MATRTKKLPVKPGTKKAKVLSLLADSTLRHVSTVADSALGTTYDQYSGFDTKDSTARRILSELRRKGLVKREGKTPGGNMWTITYRGRQVAAKLV